MLAKVGDIYSVFSHRLQQYVACQVTAIDDAASGSAPLAAILQLDWTGNTLPDAHAVQAMRPLVCDYYFWNKRHDHSFASATVPRHYTLVANVAPLVETVVKSYSGGWHVGDSVWRQRRWEQVDPARRQRFKAASSEEVMVGGQAVRQKTSRIGDDILQAIGDLSELDQLPCLTTIETRHGSAALAAYINGNPIINEVHWQSSTEGELDLRNSNVSRLVVHAAGLRSLRLNEGLSTLILNGAPSPSLRIDDPHAGRFLRLQCSGALAPFHGLDQLARLSLSAMPAVDFDMVAQRFPLLTDLTVWGKPGLASNLASIARLDRLRSFTAYELFGYGADDFPAPAQLPALSSLCLASLPADAAKAIKAKYKKAAVLGLNLSVTRPRKPEWLAENLDNPFRDWDGRVHISVAYAKKAAQAYKKLLATARTLDGVGDAETVQAVAQEMVTAYVGVFNQIERRSSVIETVERDEIYVALEQVLAQVPLRDVAALYALFDRLRDF
ncbi:hypothetical protein JAB5_35670 [Janthinobacterium sp. HH103]|uniref:hypothetical protein n=1 Tax=unclassified Janthinobacterium TaxID=2610881 RepID=UPI000874D2BB|nr:MULTISPECIES: hypothetical protein [unclassified Janthinobacterium]OEZ69338.1 hypothetical protein JAB2_13860 [Janthinobacterium sp. HH100]OEZ73118.1 hypothetical protein JAB5_35670 [Janthinobacterium sp. HH103]QOU73152.1 hypothetical protein JAB4_026070 [Janthinobacterium sp. HH102]